MPPPYMEHHSKPRTAFTFLRFALIKIIKTRKVITVLVFVTMNNEITKKIIYMLAIVVRQ